MDEENITLDPEALDGAESDLSGRNGLYGMKAAFAGVASSRAMFGDVPNAEAASAALESAAHSLIEQIERAGGSIESIAADAGTAAGIARGTDAEAHRVLTYEEHLALSFEGRINDQHFHIEEGH
ncbi:hypothetical protein [Streptomyces sp. SM12]|uniref:hypothetical protein n=1 Tax=Streptomyces sp. SM12 TaxID=1071602 RepID=UPI000CD511A3|nr:hypothetical protein [Streptomyces sp. SM12]